MAHIASEPRKQPVTETVIHDSAESLSIIVMAYDEALSISEAVEEVVEAARVLNRVSEIIIVDDGSADGTGRLADELAGRYSTVRVIHHESNRGLGGVYRTGFAEAKCNILYFMAADLQPIPGLYLKQFLPLLDECDIVLGRLRSRDDPWISKFFSGAERILFRFLFPGVPKLEGPFMFKRAILDEVSLSLMDGSDRSWMILWELFARAKKAGFKIATCETSRRPRTQGESKGNTWANVAHMLKAAFTLRKMLSS